MATTGHMKGTLDTTGTRDMRYSRNLLIRKGRDGGGRRRNGIHLAQGLPGARRRAPRRPRRAAAVSEDAMITTRIRRSFAVLTLSAFVFTGAPAAYAHDPKPGFNVFSAEQEVQLGRQAAAEAERQVPVLNDRSVTNYVNSIVNRLESVAPFRDYPYQARVVNSSDINAFALPGGFV